MNAKITPELPLFYILPGFILILSFCGDVSMAKDNISVEKNSITNCSEVDKPLKAFQNELLDLAFKTATAIPINPHIKDRSKAQEGVVSICLKLDQPKQAAAYIEQIQNWHRQSCYVDLAEYWVHHNNLDAMKYYISRAELIDASAEDWQKDTIQKRISLIASQVKEISETFEQKTSILDKTISTGEFESVKNSLEIYTQLFNSYYRDEKRRSLAEEKIKASWSPMPIFIRFEFLVKMTEYALEHSDKKKAQALVNEAQEFLTNYQWPLEQRLPQSAKLAELRFMTGDNEKTKIDAAAALALFQEQGKTIVNIWRAGALRPLAQAYSVMGDKAAALSVYKQIIEEGMANPNSRPRAEDLSATCSSMALFATEPDAELWIRIHQIYQGLGQPW